MYPHLGRKLGGWILTFALYFQQPATLKLDQLSHLQIESFYPTGESILRIFWEAKRRLRNALLFPQNPRAKNIHRAESQARCYDDKRLERKIRRMGG
jgi:hypothetical protein